MSKINSQQDIGWHKSPSSCRKKLSTVSFFYFFLVRIHVKIVCQEEYDTRIHYWQPLGEHNKTTFDICVKGSVYRKAFKYINIPFGTFSPQCTFFLLVHHQHKQSCTYRRAACVHCFVWTRLNGQIVLDTTIYNLFDFKS